MSAKKYDYDNWKAEEKKPIRGGPRRVVFDHVTGGMMFDTYQSIKDLEKEGKFSEKQAASIVKIISRSSEQNISNLATKQDIELLRNESRQDIELLRNESRQDIELLRNESRQDIELLRNESRQNTALLKKDISHLEERMATKEELEKVRFEVATMQTKIIVWLISISVTMCGSLIAAMYYMIRYLPTLQPIIQNIPH